MNGNVIPDKSRGNQFPTQRGKIITPLPLWKIIILLVINFIEKESRIPPCTKENEKQKGHIAENTKTRQINKKTCTPV